MFTRVPYSQVPLFAEFRRLEEELDELFVASTPWNGGIRSLPPGTFPAINVGTTGDNVTVYIFAPGINPKQLDRMRDRFTIAGAKDDRLDAFVLADSLRTDMRFYRFLDPADPQPDRAQAYRGIEHVRQASSPAADAGRVSRTRPLGLL